MSYDVCDLVVTSVVEFAHGMENASLYRFQTVVHVRNGTFQNNVRGIVQEPVLVHAGQFVGVVFAFGVGVMGAAMFIGACFIVRHLFGEVFLYVLVKFVVVHNLVNEQKCSVGVI